MTPRPSRRRVCLVEAALIAAFMLSATAWATLLQHPSSPLAAEIPDGLVRRLVMGVAMGATAITLIYSKLGAMSGAHMNPAVTLAFWRLGAIDTRLAIGYIASQFVGAAAGALAATWLLAGLPADPSINFIATVPGDAGTAAAFAGESAIAAGLMALVLTAMRRATLSQYTGVFAGAYVALCIALEAPLSGMSMNPARTFGSNVWAGRLDIFWIYLIAPTLGMQAVVSLRGWLTASDHTAHRWCPRLFHPSWSPCVFGCDTHVVTPDPLSRSASDVQLTVV